MVFQNSLVPVGGTSCPDSSIDRMSNKRMNISRALTSSYPAAQNVGIHPSMR